MTKDVPEGALTIERVIDWLPDQRLPIEYLPKLIDQDVDRIYLQVGMFTGDEEGEWITTLYVGDRHTRIFHSVGYDVELEGWVGIDTWVGDEYDPELAESVTVDWVDEHYPDSSFSHLE